jgi:hypothetical protein
MNTTPKTLTGKILVKAMKFRGLSALTVGGLAVLATTMWLKNSSPSTSNNNDNNNNNNSNSSNKKKRAGPAVIDAEYAGYREKTSDYPNRNKIGTDIAKRN